MKTLIIEEFTRVKNSEGQEGTVESNLSCQVTVRYDNGTFGWLFKKDRGVDWQIITKENDNGIKISDVLRNNRIQGLKSGGRLLRSKRLKISRT